jgi:hypothetical protein
MQEQNCEVFTTIVVRRPEYNTLIQTQVHTGCHVSPPAKLIKHKRFSPSKTTTRLFLFKKIVRLPSGRTASRKVLSRSSGGTCRSERRSSLVQQASNGTSASPAHGNVSKENSGHVKHNISNELGHIKTITNRQIDTKKNDYGDLWIHDYEGEKHNIHISR